jgi:hypothetical protein
LEKKDIMIIRDDAFMLLAFLRPSKVMVNVHGRQCLDKLLGWHRICLPAARRRLIEMGLIELGWHSARWSIGVVDLIRSGEVPARVPDAIIAEIRQRENSRGYVELPEPILRPGDAVRVLAGPLRRY